MRHWFAVILAAWGGFTASPVLAQDWPRQAITIIVPFAPGGSADTLGRVLAQGLTERLGQPVVVDNRGGAGGTIGARRAAQAAPNGYTLVISGIGSHVIAPALGPAGFDPMADFTHIALLGGPPTVMVAHPSLGVTTLADLVAAGRAGRDFVYASPGAGTHGHLIAELFRRRADLRMEHAAYRGAGAAINDLVAGHVPLGSITLATAAAQLRAGRLRALAITAARRVPQFAEAPTFAELGYPELVATTWFALSAPAGLPAAIVDRLNREATAVMTSPQAQERLRADAIVFEPLDPAGVRAYFASEIARWAPIARESGATLE